MQNFPAPDEYIIATKKLDVVKDSGELEIDWKKLEINCSTSFFLSWHWINAWISCCAYDVEVFRVERKGEVVAIALISRCRQVRHGFLSFSSIHLSHTGDRQRDQIWPEYTGILAAAEHEESVYFAVIRYLSANNKKWDEFYSGVMDQRHLNFFLRAGKSLGLWSRNYWEAKGFSVNLEAIRKSQPDYLSTLSKNTRSQIRRTITQLKIKGEVTFVEAKNVGEAQKMLLEIAQLHRAKWDDESGFNNKIFTQFHQTLVQNSFDLGVIELFAIYLNGKMAAGLYNFIYGSQVLFYLSGIAKENDNRLKIGLAAHSICIQKHLDAGKSSYDFMGGEMRYKQSLSNTVYKLSFAVLEKPGLKFAIEHLARNAKQALSSWQK